MKLLGTVAMAMAVLFTTACGTTNESSGGGSNPGFGASSSTAGCEGLTGQALQRCQVRRDQGSANR